jgi:hypothetical protein
MTQPGNFWLHLRKYFIQHRDCPEVVITYEAVILYVSIVFQLFLMIV